MDQITSNSSMQRRTLDCIGKSFFFLNIRLHLTISLASSCCPFVAILVIPGRSIKVKSGTSHDLMCNRMRDLLTFLLGPTSVSWAIRANQKGIKNNF